MLCNAVPVFKTGNSRLYMKNSILHVGFGAKVHFLHPWTPRLNLSLKSQKITVKKPPDIFCSGPVTVEGSATKYNCS